tara:strand:+ start:3173 stop:3439 length:267 start_codon:yes stop_codon:yes gene_type:complete
MAILNKKSTEETVDKVEVTEEVVEETKSSIYECKGCNKTFKKGNNFRWIRPKAKFDNGTYVDNIFIVWNWCKPCGESKAKEAFGYINN